MLICLIHSLCFCKEILFNFYSSENESCYSLPGCNIKNANASLSSGYTVRILNNKLTKKDAYDFITWINTTTFKNITLVGNEKTLIEDPDFEHSEFPAIYVENSTFRVENITFSNFKIPILNGMNSDVSVFDSSFSDSECIKSSLLAFVGSKFSLIRSKIKNNTANTQSLLAAVNSTIVLNETNLDTNFLESRDMRAALHFLNSYVQILGGLFYSNTLKLPLIASSNSSRVILSGCNFEYNEVLCMFAMEFNSSFDVDLCKFAHNIGTIFTAAQLSCVQFKNSIIEHHESADMLLGTVDSEMYVSNISCSESHIVGFAYMNIMGKLNYSLNAQKVKIRKVFSKLPLFTIIGGNANFNDCKIDDIVSESEIVLFSHQNGNSTFITSSYFSNISSKNTVATGISGINCTNTKISNITFSNNMVCGLLFENTSISIDKSNFNNNQCFPQGNSIPLAISTTSLSNKLDIEDTLFVNNTALAGSIFLMNVSSSLNNIKFINNKAIQGAGIFSVNSNLSVKESIFNKNNAMALGGAISFASGNAMFEYCNFTKNSAPEGSVFSIKEGMNFTINNCESNQNTGANATFISGDGEKLRLTISETNVDDIFEKAIYLSNFIYADFRTNRFNCKLNCKNGDYLTPKPKEKNKNVNLKSKQLPKVNKHINKDEDFDKDDSNDLNIDEEFETQALPLFWLSVPIILLFCLFVYKKFGSYRIFMFINSLFGLKGKHYN